MPAQTSPSTLLTQAEQDRLAGRLRQSEARCRQALQQLGSQDAPGLRAAAHQTLSLLAHQVGKPKQAAELMGHAVNLAPEAAVYRRNLCEMLRRLGRLEEAIGQGREATRLAPQDPSAWYNLGVALNDQAVDSGEVDDLESARTAFAKAVELDPRHNLAWNNLGSILNRQGDENASLEAYLKAVQIDPNHAEAQNNIAAICIERGELDDARRRLHLAIDASPDFLEAHQNLSTLTKYTSGDPHYRYLEAQLVRRNALDAKQRLQMLFAVGKARDDVGLQPLALIAYHEANRLKRASLHYDEANAERTTLALSQGFAPGDFPDAGPRDDPTPVFIVGMPRSGTTLIEQVLCSHPQVHGAGELRDFHEVLRAHPRTGDMAEARHWQPRLTDEDYREIGQAYLGRLRRHDAKALRITDKMPGNFNYLGFICRALPGARIVHSMRDPMDSCLSNYSKLFNDTMEFAYDLQELGRYYNRYIGRMRHWERVLPPGRVLHLRYEEMVADLPTQARRLISHVGLDWDEGCLKFHENRRKVRTASVAQVRKPIYASSTGRWKAYGEGLAPLRAIVGEEYPHGLD